MGCSIPLLALAALIAVLVLAACGGSGSSHAPVTGTQAANALVCRHYLAQRDWVKSITFPTLADVEKMTGYVAADDAQASGKLRRDLGAMLADIEAGRSDYAASKAVYQDCTG